MNIHRSPARPTLRDKSGYGRAANSPHCRGIQRQLGCGQSPHWFKLGIGKTHDMLFRVFGRGGRRHPACFTQSQSPASLCFMIEFGCVSKSFGGETILAEVSFRIHPCDRIRIVGPNGAGKTTLFALITGEMQPDKGRVSVRRGSRLGYVRQQLHAHVTEKCILAHVENAMPEIPAMEREMRALEQALPQTPPDARAPLLRRLGELQTRLEIMGGYALRHRAEQALSGLGFQATDFHKPLRSFSGGWLSRAELGRILVTQPDILLLDEPSNYLDTPTVEWLQKYLREFRGTLLLISHDRFLLNTLTSATLEVANAKTERYPGNYNLYIERRSQRMEQQLGARKNQERERARIERFIDRFRAQSTKAALVQSRIKQLERLNEITVPERIVTRGRLRLAAPKPCGAEVMRLENAGLSYDGVHWVLRNIDLQVNRGDKLALLGYNGLGKTTLLRALAGQMPLAEGRRVLGHNVAMGYQSQDFAETMDPRATVFNVVKNVAEDASSLEVRTLLGSLGFSGDSVEKTTQVLSGGEKIRLAFARLLIRPPNFLLLDEPTTHLDIQARQALEQALADFEGTLCVVSHDIDFLRRVATGIIALTPPGITRYAGGYDYFREKSAVESQIPAASDMSARNNSNNRREQRRRRALERQAVQSRLRALKRDAQRAEEQVAVFEAEREKIVEQLSGDSGNLDFAALNRRLLFIQTEIERYTQRWENSMTELQELENNPLIQASE